MAKPVLYSYFRSTCAWRVRIALALKNIDYVYKPVLLNSGEQFSQWYSRNNPQSVVPTLIINGHTLTQSLPIIEYLDEVRPKPTIIPRDDPYRRYQVLQAALLIATDMQPLQTSRVLKVIGEEKNSDYVRKIMLDGFQALEVTLSEKCGKYCVGDEITLPDICLVPQVELAQRIGVDTAKFPTVSRIDAELNKIEAFQITHPSKVPDFLPHLPT